jgi:penicillin-binding protein 2
MRIKVLSMLFCAMLAFLSASLFKMQILRYDEYRLLGEKNCVRSVPQPGARGNIVDSKGEIIAGCVLSYDAMLLPVSGGDSDKSIAKMSSVLDIDKNILNKNLRKNTLTPFTPVVLLTKIDRSKAIALEECRMDYPGIVVQTRPLRSYPNDRLAAHILGYLSQIDAWRLTKLENYGYKTKNIVGYTGLEEKYDYYLREEEGASSLEVNHRGILSRTLGFKPPQSGKELGITIDLGLQKIVEDALCDKKGSVVIMDPDNGAILCMASSPGFDPSVFINNNSGRIKELLENKDSPLLNRAISGAYPPGSVFKLVVACAILESGKFSTDSLIFCDGGIDVGKKRFNCSGRHGDENICAALAHSCNTYFYRAGLAIGPQTIHDFAIKLGFGKPTQIDLPYEASGFVPDPMWKKLRRFKRWYNGDTANFSIGQGDLLVTPLQVARMMSVFANRGTLVRPYLLKSFNGAEIREKQEKFVKVDIKPVYMGSIRRGLRQAVSDPSGTAHVLASLPVEVAGKTGTAQVTAGACHAWFAGFFPYEKPKFSICVFLENGVSGGEACLLARQVIEAMIANNICNNI